MKYNHKICHPLSIYSFFWSISPSLDSEPSFPFTSCLTQWVGRLQNQILFKNLEGSLGPLGTPNNTCKRFPDCLSLSLSLSLSTSPSLSLSSYLSMFGRLEKLPYLKHFRDPIGSIVFTIFLHVRFGVSSGWGLAPWPRSGHGSLRRPRPRLFCSRLPALFHVLLFIWDSIFGDNLNSVFIYKTDDDSKKISKLNYARTKVVWYYINVDWCTR